MAFDQGRNVGVLRSRYQISLPVTGNGTIFDLGWALTYRYDIGEIALSRDLYDWSVGIDESLVSTSDA